MTAVRRTCSRCQRNPPQLDVIAVVLGEPCGQVLFRHEHPARIEVADVEHDQIAAVVIFGNVMGCGGAAESVHRKEADGVLVEHRGKHAAHGALLGPDLDAMRLLVPEIAAIGSRDTAGVFGRIGPC